LSQDWHGQVLPGYGAGLSRVQVDEWRNCGAGSESRFFFNPALGHDRFDCSLGAAAVHVGCGAANTLG
jgi:hypothetical protein